MAKGYFKKKFYNKDLDLITDKTERFIVFINDFKQIMGTWYSVVALRILPMLLFFIPVNVVLARFTLYYKNHFQPDLNWDGPILMVLWAIAMALLLVLAILLPKVATVYELGFGFTYLFFAFKNHLFNSAVGIILLICMIIFLLVKLFFLAVKILSMVKFSGDEANIERDESGRIVRKTEGEVLFVNSEEFDKNRPAASADNDFLFEKTDDVQAQGAEARMEYNSDFFFDKVDDTPEKDAQSSYDDDFFFTKGGDDDNNMPLAGSDDDFVF